MAENNSLSAIHNPLNPTRALIFHITPKSTLSLSQRPLTGEANASHTSIANSTPLAAQSTIVALRFSDVTQVYGIPAESQTISLISPVLQPLPPKFKCVSGVLAGTVFSGAYGSGGKAWIANTDRDEEGTQGIYYCDVSAPAPKRLQFDVKDVGDRTGLSLFHDTKRLWAVYQNADRHLVVVDQKEGVASTVHCDASLSVKGTAIGSVFIPGNKITNGNSESLGRVIVYWINHSNDTFTLYRSHADIDPKSSVLQFSTPTLATADPVIVDEDTKFSVIADEKEQCNHVFVSNSGEDSLIHVTDSWGAECEE